ncbi:MAG: c-type cytochrome, partial [Alphaproteobacteria bacterium]|nr:c-type cytochrome [Alphaproteobacteria bacterium]
MPDSELKGRALILVGASRHDVDLVADGESLTAEVPLRAEDRAAAVVIIEGKEGSRVARFGQSAYIEPRLDPKAAKGREVYRESCAACHGTALRGTDSGPPLLHSFYTLGSGHGDGVILDAIRKG